VFLRAVPAVDTHSFRPRLNDSLRRIVHMFGTPKLESKADMGFDGSQTRLTARQSRKDVCWGDGSSGISCVSGRKGGSIAAFTLSLK